MTNYFALADFTKHFYLPEILLNGDLHLVVHIRMKGPIHSIFYLPFYFSPYDTTLTAEFPTRNCHYMHYTNLHDLVSIFLQLI